MRTKNITRLAKPDIYGTRAERTCAMRRQSRWNTLTQIEQENLPTCANQKYDMTCEAWYLWDSRGAHLRYEMPIKMEFAHTNKTWITTDLREPKIFSCFCLKVLNIYFNAFLRYVSEAFQMVPNILGNPARIRVQWSGAQAIRLAISLWEDNYTREKWEDVQWGQNELRMRARRVAKRLSRDSLGDES